ncbi:MAG TPA: endonuclease/exonuclease/phosphatase family protein, partial [Actinomycetota bacterium]
LFLHLVFWGNAAFVGSELGWPLAASVAWVLAAAALAVWAAARVTGAPPGAGARAGLAAGFVAGTALLALAGGPLVAAGALLAAGTGGALLALALATEPGEARGGDGVVRTAAALALGMTAFVGFAFAYQIDVNVPLPVPRATFPLVAAGLVGLVAMRPRVPDAEPIRTAVLVPLGVLAVVPLALVLTGSRPDPAPGDGEAVIVDWNIHTAVDAHGQIDLEGVAALIEAQDPDVVVLQEVGRGWPIAGSIDQLEWLSRRLDLPYAWAKAGDDQFGNAVLSRLPMTDPEILGLPYGEGPQWRSALRVEVEISPGEFLPVIGVHLQNDDSRATTRTEQIEALLATWDGTAVMTGDFNMQPTESENVSMIEDAGYVSLQDTLGDLGASTARDPLFEGDRVDWMFVRDAVDARSFAILRSEASDHLPLRAVVRLGYPAEP